MTNIFLVTILTCSQIVELVKRVESVSILSPQQKYEIVNELRKVVTSCPIVIKKN